MSVGSGFDTYVKVFLTQRLFGKQKGFVFDELFERQVEVQNRDFALKAGASCFMAYKESGALADILKLCEQSPKEPRFEFTAQGEIDPVSGGVINKVGNVVLLGKPDAMFATTNGVDVAFDWKVNGYCANSPKQPSRGYVKLRDGKQPAKQHKDVNLYYEGNVLVNLDNMMIDAEPQWAKQTTTYAWLVGVPVGNEFICAIDQLCCSPSFPQPMIQVAEHRVFVPKSFQEKLHVEYQELWDIVNSNHIFRDLSLEDSIARCDVLSKQAEIFQSDDPKVQWALKASRS